MVFFTEFVCNDIFNLILALKDPGTARGECAIRPIIEDELHGFGSGSDNFLNRRE